MEQQNLERAYGKFMNCWIGKCTGVDLSVWLGLVLVLVQVGVLRSDDQIIMLPLAFQGMYMLSKQVALLNNLCGTNEKAPVSPGTSRSENETPTSARETGCSLKLHGNRMITKNVWKQFTYLI